MAWLVGWQDCPDVIVVRTRLTSGGKISYFFILQADWIERDSATQENELCTKGNLLLFTARTDGSGCKHRLC